MTERLAIEGGAPVRERILPYSRQSIEAADIESVVAALRSDWLTTGPKVSEFEKAFAESVRSREAVAVSSGTAALHAAMHALGVGPGDEVIVPALTFVASANCVVFQGGTPVFADIDPHTLLIDPIDVEAKISARTKAIVAVDYAGHPCPYDPLRAIARKHGVQLVADACHSLGASYRGCPVGTLGDLNAFSLHPVKPITTGEGGVMATDSAELAARARRFRNHGVATDHFQRERQGTWFYEMVELGYNYRLTDIQCALGVSQLQRLSQWAERRREVARRYDRALSVLPAVRPQRVECGVTHAYHLYVVQLDLDALNANRAAVFAALRAEGIGVNVHYLPVHLHPYYRDRFATRPGQCPVAEAAYERLMSLPIFPAMTDGDIEDVIRALNKVNSAYQSRKSSTGAAGEHRSTDWRPHL